MEKGKTEERKKFKICNVRESNKKNQNREEKEVGKDQEIKRHKERQEEKERKKCR